MWVSKIVVSWYIGWIDPSTWMHVLYSRGCVCRIHDGRILTLFNVMGTFMAEVAILPRIDCIFFYLSPVGPQVSYITTYVGTSTRRSLCWQFWIRISSDGLYLSTLRHNCVKFCAHISDLSRLGAQRCLWWHHLILLGHWIAAMNILWQRTLLHRCLLLSGRLLSWHITYKNDY